MLAAFHFENFKSYKKATLPLAPLTLLVGANASGKSNALEGMRLLCNLAKGPRLYEVLTGLPTEVRGSIENLAREGETSFILGCQLDTSFQWNSLSLAVDWDVVGPFVKHESVTAVDNPKEFLYKSEKPTVGTRSEEQLKIKYGASLPEAEHLIFLNLNNQQPVFVQLATFLNESLFLHKQTAAFKTALTSAQFLDPVPSLMRSYVHTSENRLRSDGANLSGVLHHLVTNKLRLTKKYNSVEAAKQAVLKFVASLPEQNIEGFDFLQTPLREVMVRITETFAGRKRKCEAVLMSDGTLRVFAIAVALLSAARNSLVVIEEIDNGIHPSRAKQLLDNIYNVAQERNLRVLLTTHNPALANALPLPALPDAVVCYRDPQEGDSRLARLGDLDEYPELVAQGKLGSLMTSGILERTLKQPKLTPEERKARNLAWLKQLRADVGA